MGSFTVSARDSVSCSLSDFSPVQSSLKFCPPNFVCFALLSSSYPNCKNGYRHVTAVTKPWSHIAIMSLWKDINLLFHFWLSEKEIFWWRVSDDRVVASSLRAIRFPTPACHNETNQHQAGSEGFIFTHQYITLSALLRLVLCMCVRVC